MKISNSKKQLAKIIHENGGWRDGAEFSAQDKDGEVFYYSSKPTIGAGREVWDWTGCIGEGEFMAKPLPNWHQTILSRDEYFHLYPAPDAALVAACADVTKENKHPEYCESVMRSIPEPSDKPTIDQLAADYRAKLAIAQQAQEEADSHRCGAEAALQKLHQAGLLLGLDIAIAHDEPEEQEDKQLNITDWRDLQVGDEVEYIYGTVEDCIGLCGVISIIDNSRECGIYRIKVTFKDGTSRWCNEWKFIRRP